MTEAKAETYLGDGAYAEFSGWDVTVYTSNGITRTRGVALGPGELQRLIRFAQQVGLMDS